MCGLVTEEVSSVEVIDFGGLADPAQRSAVCAKVAKACETVGFFEIRNSGISHEVLDEAFDVSREFYDQPLEEKMKLQQDLKENTPAVSVFQLGYKHYPLVQTTENRMEEMIYRHYHSSENVTLSPGISTKKSFHAGEVDPTQNWWPDTPGDYRDKVERLIAELGKVADTLLDVFSESLGLPRTFLRKEHHKNTTVPRYVTVHHYPKATKLHEDEVGILPHRDSSVFTIVAQGYGTAGLKIKPYGEWLPVLPQRGGLVVNVGDILQAWSNGRYRSILHRVVSNKVDGRHSLAYFLFPAPGPEADYMVEPIPQLITEKNPLKYRPFSYLDFFKNKMQSWSEAFEEASNAGWKKLLYHNLGVYI